MILKEIHNPNKGRKGGNEKKWSEMGKLNKTNCIITFKFYVNLMFESFPLKIMSKKCIFENVNQDLAIC